MRLSQAVMDELAVPPGQAARLATRDTASTAARWLPKGTDERELAEDDLRAFTGELETAQELLWSSNTHALLVVFQAMDAAGKDGTIKHVMSGVNPQGCEVTSFKQPSSEELAHDFLWRYATAAPARGRIGIFNRSYYEEVLVVRVHPELLANEFGSAHLVPKHVWRDRFDDINAFEAHLHRSGTRIVKIFLHVSKDEQKRRFLDRLDDPSKLWKFSVADLAERAFWDDYQAAYEEALGATSTAHAPWYVVPADHKYAMRALVAGILVHAVEGMALTPPQVDPAEAARLAEAREALGAE